MYPKKPDNFDQLDDSEQRIEEDKFNSALLTKTYELRTEIESRTVDEAMEVPEMFKELFVRCGEAFDAGVVPLRQILIDLSRVWDELEVGKCSYSFSDEEISTHNKELKEYHDFHTVQSVVRDYLSTDADGWIASGRNFDEALAMNRELFELYLKYEADGKSREELLELCPFAAAL